MRFLADMGVSLQTVQWLRSQGHDAIHLREEGLQRLPNGAIFAKAHKEKRIVLTFDLDFGEIAALSKGQTVSAVVFRLHNARSAHVIDRLHAILNDSTIPFDTGAVVVVEESRHRIRSLPISL